MRQHILLLISCFLLMLVSCNNNDHIENELKDFKSRPVILKTDKMICEQLQGNNIYKNPSPDFTWVTFVDSTRCSSCIINGLYEWDRIIEQYKDIRYIFIIECPSSEKLNDIIQSLRSSILHNEVYIDTLCSFSKSNPHIPHNPQMHTFLLDKSDSVILVGNPINNQRIEELFHKIIKEGTDNAKR